MFDISVSVKVAVQRGSNELLLLSYMDEYFHYNLPGGRVNGGESLSEAATRKVLEETGIAVQDVRPLFAVEYVPDLWHREFGSVQKVQFQFVASAPDGAEPKFSDPRDSMQIGFDWVSLDDLLFLPLLPRINEHVVAALRGAEVPALVDRW